MRKSRSKRRPVNPDPRFNDELASRFVNSLIRRGKKTIAYNIFYDTVDRISDQTKDSGFEIFKKAIDNLQPSVEVRSRRIGGANFQIPTEVRPTRRLALAFKWLISYAKERNGRSMADKLAAEPDFEIISAPVLSLFSFRHKGGDDADQHNIRLVNAINDDGRIYLTQTRVDGRIAIRFQAGQFEMTRDDAEAAFAVITEIARAQT